LPTLITRNRTLSQQRRKTDLSVPKAGFPSLTARLGAHIALNKLRMSMIARSRRWSRPTAVSTGSVNARSFDDTPA